MSKSKQTRRVEVSPPSATGGIAAMIEEKVVARDARYGDYAEEAALADMVMNLLTDRGERLLPYQRQAIRMIATKLSRLVSGDSNWLDGWVDIAGYSILVARQLKKRGR